MADSEWMRIGSRYMLRVFGFVWLSIAMLALAAVTPARAKEKQKLAEPEQLSFENDSYKVTCTSKVKDACLYLDRFLREAEKERQRLERERKRKQLQSGTIEYDDI